MVIRLIHANYHNARSLPTKSSEPVADESKPLDVFIFRLYGLQIQKKSAF